MVLEALTPSERLAFVLHDMFGVPFDEIGQVVGRTPAAARQLASRGRRRVRGAPLNTDVDLAAAARACRGVPGGVACRRLRRLVAVLDPEVVFRADTGDASSRARPPIEGALAVAGRVIQQGRPLAGLARHATVNGGAGLVVGRPGRVPIAVVGFTVAGGRIAAIDLITDRAKLKRVGAT